ncbi:MAG: hypothetical protein R3E10_02865 [Gemmatimonadota bacterium]
MRQLVVDKIASVTRNASVGRSVWVGDEFPCVEGDVVAVRILTRKSTYNQLELPTGRFSSLKPGDVVVGALGHRRALGGYAGHIPTSLATGATTNILNLGGVIGTCTSYSPEVGPPFECEVLGQVLSFPYLGERIGIPANIRRKALPMPERLEVGTTPVIAVVGTSMNAGKTLACSSLIQELAHRNLRVHGGKTTGVSLRRDVLHMEDSGAVRTAVFTDFGVVTTRRENAPSLARAILTTLAEDRPDVLVLELGDGLFGDYGVDAILDDEALRRSFSAVVLAATDPVGAYGGLRVLEETYGIRATVVTGPATDNAAGTEVIEARFGVRAINARVSPSELADVVLEGAGIHARRANGGG